MAPLEDPPAGGGDPTRSVRLAQVDQLASRLVAEAAPLQLTLAITPEARDAIFRLRYQVVIERGWAQPADLPDQREQDDYDAHAILIAAWDGTILAATARIVLPQPGSKLPTEATFGLSIEPRGAVADMGRQIVARAYTSVRHRVFAALLARTWLEIRQHGCWLVCGDFSPAMIRLYKIMGFDVTQLGPPRTFWGEERLPVLVDVARAASTLVQKWTP